MGGRECIIRTLRRETMVGCSFIFPLCMDIILIRIASIYPFIYPTLGMGTIGDFKSSIQFFLAEQAGGPPMQDIWLGSVYYLLRGFQYRISGSLSFGHPS